MTTEEHLTRIHNLFAKIEEMEKLATEFPWIYDPENKLAKTDRFSGYRNAPQMIWGPKGPGYGTVAETCSAGLMPYPGGQQARDASFIALNRNIIVPLVKYASTQLRDVSYAYKTDFISQNDPRLTTLLSLFPDELLTLCGV